MCNAFLAISIKQYRVQYWESTSSSTDSSTHKEQFVQTSTTQARSERVVFLNGERLYLRPECKSDVPLFVRWFNDPEVTSFSPARHPVAEKDESDWVRSLEQKSDLVMLTIVLKGETPDADRPIGALGIHSIDQVSRVATTGITIGETSCWGRGYAAEAESLLLGYVFNVLNLRKIYANVLSTNIRSRRLFEKSGYGLEAVLRKRHFRLGRYVDELVFSIDAVMWRKCDRKLL
ncbi:MAG: GNAT family protein [Patescibacteria group bacterium]